jgi:hypothetical protein
MCGGEEMTKVAGLQFADRYRELISDQTDYIEQLKKEKEAAEKNYLDTLEKLKKTDAALENMKNLDLTHQKAINRYVKENKALRELVTLWI